MEEENRLIKMIIDKTKIDGKELLERIDAKEKEFDGLVSRTGAIYIVGKELGVNLIKPLNRLIKIERVAAGMNEINFKGKVVSVSEIREFNVNGREGKVQNVLFGDDTGCVRLSLWNEEIEQSKIEEGDAFELRGLFAKKDNWGNVELRLGKKGTIKKIEDKIEIVKMPMISRREIKDTLKDVHVGDYVDIKAAIVQVYERIFIHKLCPKCNKKVEDNKCVEHGPVEGKTFFVLSGVVDDGYDNINAVFMNEVIEALTEKKLEELEKEFNDENIQSFFKLIKKGKDFRMKGVIRKNNVLGTLELHTEGVTQLDIPQEINNLINE